MNYRHHYHAGNFADVFKHIVLVELLLKLREKETPFCVVDTHAGLGLYPLCAVEAQKTLEYQQGIECFWTQSRTQNQDQDAFIAYKRVIQSVNGAPGEKLKNYPGSPVFARFYLRQQDHLWLSELHPEDSKILNRFFQHDDRVRVFHQDGYQMLRAVLPPLERRGLVLIDPPFEQRDEFDTIINGLKQGLKRFAHGIYMVWYPLKEDRLVDTFYKQVSVLKFGDSLRVEINTAVTLGVGDEGKLKGCGLLILNAPWRLEEKLQTLLPLMIKALAFKGSFKINKMVGQTSSQN